MTETPSEPDAPLPDAPRDPVQLLVSAVGTLPRADQDLVYAWLLRRGPDPAAAGLLPGGARSASLAALLRSTVTLGHGMQVTQSPGMPMTQSSGQQMVPVRFSSEQHARLREWCTEHGFSMATVIRGLVSRFLEGQLPEAGQQA
jgi:ParG protein